MVYKNINLWLQQYPTSDKAKYNLICFPHAGGGASFFRQWHQDKALQKYNIFAIRYPGRTERIGEPCYTDLKLLASDIAKVLQNLTNLPLVFFGHSMGAPIALETARALEVDDHEVMHIFASGSCNGPLPRKDAYIEEDDESLCKHLVEMGGTDPDIISDPTFQDLVIPAIKTDGKMFHNYNMELSPKLRCPVTTIRGTEDQFSDIRPWEDIAPNGFTKRDVAGGHFYLIESPPFSILREL